MKTDSMPIQNISIKLYGILAAVILLSLLSSCKKDEATNQIQTIPGFPVNTTISKLAENGTGAISGDPVVWGFITAAGQAQNLPGMVIIQDDDAAIAIKVEEAQLDKFKFGTLLFVKGKGLTLKKEGSFYVLTKMDGSALTAADVEEHLGLGAKNQKVPVTELSIEELTASKNQQLVTLKDVEIANEYVGETFGPLSGTGEKEVLLQDCAGNAVTVISNGSSAIATTIIPEGRGNLKGIFTINNNRKELRLLDENAAKELTQIRCAGSGDITLTRAIKGIVEAGEGSTTAASTELKVVNISSSVSESNGGITVQDASGGIFIAGVTTANYPLGAALIIHAGNKQLAMVNGRLAITGITNADIQIAGTYQYPPKITSIANMLTENMGNTLVQMNNISITLYDEFASEKVYRLRDNSGKIQLAVANTANLTLTEGTASVTGYFIRENGENKFRIRQQSDVTYGGTAPNPDPNYIIETFATSYGINKSGNQVNSGKASYYYTPEDATYDNYLYSPITGKWLFYGALFWKTRATDIVNPTAILIGASAVNTTPPTAGFPDKGPGYIETQFGFDGMKRVKVKFGSNYTTTTTYTVELRISTNEGATWTSLGTKSVARNVLEIADFSPNIPRGQKVRLQIVNQTTGTNGRWGALMNIVSITVEQPD